MFSQHVLNGSPQNKPSSINISDTSSTSNQQGASFLKSMLTLTSQYVDDISKNEPLGDKQKDQKILKSIHGTINRASKFLDSLPVFTDEEMADINKQDQDVNITNEKAKGITRTNLKFYQNFIEGTYGSDLDIKTIHQYILDYLAIDRDERIKTLYNELINCQKRLEEPLNIVVSTSLTKRVRELTEDIKKLEEESDISEYVDDVDELLNEFENIGPFKEVIDILSDTSTYETISDIRRINIIDEYVIKARHHFDLRIERIINKGRICPVCRTSLIDVSPRDGCIYCPGCDSQLPEIIQSAYMTDGSRVNPLSKNNYVNRSNFEDIFCRYCGIYPVNLMDNMLNDLDDHFAYNNYRFNLLEDDNNHPTSYRAVEIKQMQTNDKGWKGPYKVRHMLNALKKTGYTSYYPDVNYICHVFWDCDLPNITHLTKQIMDDYDVSNDVYQQIKSKYKKTSSINTTYHLYRLLEKNGVNCDHEDFKIIITHSILTTYEKMWKEICLVAEWPIPKPIPVNVANAPCEFD